MDIKNNEYIYFYINNRYVYLHYIYIYLCVYPLFFSTQKARTLVLFLCFFGNFANMPKLLLPVGMTCCCQLCLVSCKVRKAPIMTFLGVK